MNTAPSETRTGTRTASPRFAHRGVQGARLPGWADVNCEKLAVAMECDAMHLRDVLAGRRGTTLRFIERVAEATGLTAAQVVCRIQKARVLDEQRVQDTLRRWIERQQKRRERQTA